MNDFLDSLSSCELIALAGIFAIMISQELTSSEIDTLGNFFSALGENLSIIASAGPCPNNSKNVS